MAKHDDDLMRIIQARIKKNALSEREAIMRSLLGDDAKSNGSSKKNQTVQEEMFASSDDPFDYHVQIGKRDIKDKQGKTLGWDKSVHRYKSKKEDDPYAEMAKGLKKKGIK